MRRKTIGLLILFILLLSGTVTVFAISGTSQELVLPPEPQCPSGAFLWQQEIDIVNLRNGRFPTSDVRFISTGTTLASIPGPYPSAFDEAVEVTITEAVAYDAYTDRAATGDQPNERFKVVFLKGGSLVWESEWTGVSASDDGLATGFTTAYWSGPIGGPALLSDGTDEILLVHWSDDQYGTGDDSITNSVTPSSVCIEYEPVDGEDPGTGTPGYWMNHPEAWPVETITIGDETYTKDEAIAWMKAPEKGDKTLTMFASLVAAKLNVEIGNDDSCIADTIAEADEWFVSYGPVGSGVRASSDAWKEGEPLHSMLDDYNNGLLCAPSRDSLE